jgi:hypothetical protein
MGVKGFWLGFLIALIIMDICLGYLVVTANWSPELATNEEDEILQNEDDYKKIQQSKMV